MEPLDDMSLCYADTSLQYADRASDMQYTSLHHTAQLF